MQTGKKVKVRVWERRSSCGREVSSGSDVSVFPHMACRLSAVSVFHRMSLAGRLSVSSSSDVSKSTPASGLSGDLWWWWWGGTDGQTDCQAGRQMDRQTDTEVER